MNRQQQFITKGMMYIFPPLVFFTTAWLPAGLQWFFLCLTGTTIIQTTATLNPAIRNWVGLPPLPSKVPNPAAAAATAAQDAATRENSPTVFTVEIPEDVDFDTLNSLLPDFNLTNPSPDAIVSLYRLLVGQSDEAETAQRELEEARAEIQRKDIELDQAIQDRETATAGLEDTLETVQKEQIPSVEVKQIEVAPSATIVEVKEDEQTVLNKTVVQSLDEIMKHLKTLEDFTRGAR